MVENIDGTEPHEKKFQARTNALFLPLMQCKVLGWDIWMKISQDLTITMLKIPSNLNLWKEKKNQMSPN